MENPMTDLKPLTEQQLTNIETRANAATPGPWELYEGYGPHFYAYLRGSHLQGIGTLNFGDGEAADADRAFVLHAREGVPALLAEIRRLRDRVAELETYATGCDAEGCVLPHSSWCERAQKTAAENDGCTCGQPWTGHPQSHAMHCWTVNPPRAEVDEMRRALADARTKTLATEADDIVAHCPDHGSKDGVWLDCHCAVADDMRRRAVQATPTP